MKRSIIAIIVY